mgnify:FL=1|jgi:hypothetical protein
MNRRPTNEPSTAVQGMGHPPQIWPTSDVDNAQDNVVADVDTAVTIPSWENEQSSTEDLPPLEEDVVAAEEIERGEVKIQELEDQLAAGNVEYIRLEAEIEQQRLLLLGATATEKVAIKKLSL